MAIAEALPIVFTAFAIAPLTYAATNIDNLILLSALQGDGHGRREIVSGFLLAAAAVLTLSVAGIAFGYLLPPRILGYLGVIPLALGIRLLVKVERTPGVPAVASLTASSVALLLVSNSVDTIVAFAPLFAESNNIARLGLVLGFAVGALAWLGLTMRLSATARAFCRNSWLGPRLAPLIMIVIGAYILWNTTTDTV